MSASCREATSRLWYASVTFATARNLWMLVAWGCTLRFWARLRPQLRGFTWLGSTSHDSGNSRYWESGSVWTCLNYLSLGSGEQWQWDDPIVWAKRNLSRQLVALQAVTCDKTKQIWPNFNLSMILKEHTRPILDSERAPWLNVA